MKNIKLLLATTAMLSMGAMTAMSTLTEDTTGSVTLSARASFTSPIRADVTPISFGLLDPVIGGTVSVNTDGSSTGNAVITKSGSLSDPHLGYITLFGGQISYDIDYAIIDEDTTGYVVFDDLSSKSITLKETVRFVDGEGLGGNGSTCGTVTNFELGSYTLDYVTSDEREIAALKIPVGATLNITNGYQPSGDATVCEGSITLTYMLNYQ